MAQPELILAAPFAASAAVVVLTYSGVAEGAAIAVERAAPIVARAAERAVEVIKTAKDFVDTFKYPTQILLTIPSDSPRPPELRSPDLDEQKHESGCPNIRPQDKANPEDDTEQKRSL